MYSKTDLFLSFLFFQLEVQDDADEEELLEGFAYRCLHCPHPHVTVNSEREICAHLGANHGIGADFQAHYVRVEVPDDDDDDASPAQVGPLDGQEADEFASEEKLGKQRRARVVERFVQARQAAR